MTDDAVTDILGPKCPSCGWRRGGHRPPAPSMGMEACPKWVAPSPDERNDNA